MQKFEKYNLPDKTKLSRRFVMPLVGILALTACSSEANLNVTIEEAEQYATTDRDTSFERDPIQQYYEYFSMLAETAHLTSTTIFNSMPCPGSTGYRVETKDTYRQGHTTYQDGIIFSSSDVDGKNQIGWVVSGMQINSDHGSYDAMCVKIHDDSGLMGFVVTDRLIKTSYQMISCTVDEDRTDELLLNSAAQNTC